MGLARWKNSPAIAADLIRYTTLVDFTCFTIIIQIDLAIAFHTSTPMFDLLRSQLLLLQNLDDLSGFFAVTFGDEPTRWTDFVMRSSTIDHLWSHGLQQAVVTESYLKPRVQLSQESCHRLHQ